MAKLLRSFLTPLKPFYFVNFAAAVLAQVWLETLYLMNLEINARAMSITRASLRGYTRTARGLAFISL